MYLLDTHVLLYTILNPNRLSTAHKELLAGKEQFYFSNLSIWEISLKYNTSKLKLNGYNPETFLKLSKQAGFNLSEVSVTEIATFYKLPYMDNHKDPFDRMLIWQCIHSKMILLSEDRKFELYKEQGLQVIS